MDRPRFTVWLILLIATSFLLSASCSRQPEVVVWDFRGKNGHPSTVGWTPKDHLDIGYTVYGDIDFTYIADVSGQTFKERCSSVGVMRDVQTGRINCLYAHFRTAIPFDEAEPLIRKILTDWSGGLNDRASTDPYPFFDDFVRAVREGKWDITKPGGMVHVVRGKDSGRVQVTFHDNPVVSRGRTKVSLMFSPEW